jgi:ankyrin repeat protein
MQVSKDYRYKKKSGCADMSGELFEVLTIEMLFCRALNTGCDFFLASNMGAVPSFDDIVLRLEQKPIFLQLKHKKNKAILKKSQLLQLNGDFSVLKYCRAYFQLKKTWSDSQDLQVCGSFEDALFIIYTKLTYSDVSESSVNSTDWQRVLNSGGSYFSFNENSHREIYKMFENLPRYKELLTLALENKQTSEGEKELLGAVQQLLNNLSETLPSRDALKKLLEDLESLGDLSGYKEFLSRFWLFTGQASERKMETIIQHEIMAALGTKNIYKLFHDNILNWYRKPDTVLTETSKLWQGIIFYCTADINKQTLKQFDVPDVCFCHDELSSMKAKLFSPDKLLHIVSNSTVLSCVKVHQSLADVRYMLVNSSTMLARNGEVLALWGQGCDILVIVWDDSVDMDSLTGQLLQSPFKKLILVAETVVLNESKYTFNILNDQIGFMQLDKASRDQLLSVPVQFQGHDVPFGEVISDDKNLQDILHADVIVQLKDKIKLGSSLTDEIDFYEPLSLQRADHVQEEILPHMTIVMPVIALQGQTVENMEMLQQDSDNKTCVFKNVDSVMEVPQRLVLISAAPGTGKSTLIMHVALHTKQADPATWVITVNLNDFSQELNTLPTNLEISHVKKFLLEVSGITAAFEPLFRNKLESMENVCVLFDGLDEVSPTYTDKVILLLQHLQTTQLKNLWITTRPNMRKKLEDKLDTKSFSLQPFSYKVQESIVSKFCKRSQPYTCEEELNEFTTKLLQLTQRSMRDRSRQFTGIPLHCMLLAEAFVEHVKIYVQKGKIDLDLFQLCSSLIERKFDIYCEKYKIDKTKAGPLQDYKHIKKYFQQKHMLAGLLTLLPKEDTKSVCTRYSSHTGYMVNESTTACFMKRISEEAKNVITEIEDGCEKMGIIVEATGKIPVFIHRIFAEYFAAHWFAKHYTQITDYPKEKLLHPEFKIVRFFLDRILCQKIDLHNAVLRQDKNLVESLLPCDINKRDEGGRTALFMAVLSCTDAGNTDNDHSDARGQILSTLLQNGADLSIADEVLCRTPFRLAVETESWYAAGLLLRKYADHSNKFLVRKNICNNTYVEKVLKVATRYGFIELVRFMMACGVNVSFTMTEGYNKTTMLHNAAKYGHLGLVKFLIENGAYIEKVESMNRRTPLMWAAAEGKVDVVEYLIQKGANSEAVDFKGNTAILIAAQHGRSDIVNLLLKLMSHSKRNKDGDNILHCAAMSDNAELVEYLLNFGLKINGSNKKHQTPLWLASRYGNLSVTQVLLQHHAKISVRDNEYGQTPLHMAAMWGHLKVVKCLVEHGANISAREKRGHTPLERAEKYKRSDVVEYLTNITENHQSRPAAIHQNRSVSRFTKS